MSSLYERLAELPLEVDGYALTGRQEPVSSGFDRATTTVRLQGGGQDGLGEDVTYDAVDHEALWKVGPRLDLKQKGTLGDFCRALDGIDLFPVPPRSDSARRFRRWAFESAALDLALRQANLSLSGALAREPRPVAFVVSLRLGEPPAAAAVHQRLARYPGLRFKLDPTSSWSDELIAELAATGAVTSVDLKGYYPGSLVEQPADAALYERVLRGFPAAWVEDPLVDATTEPLLVAHQERITWDAPITCRADLDGLPFPPRMINVKPSRFGRLSELLATYELCEARGISVYGGGQFELGPGRGQIQYLAALFHADAPNDVAPRGYNEPRIVADLPPSPLAPAPSETGFRWGE